MEKYPPIILLFIALILSFSVDREDAMAQEGPQRGMQGFYFGTSALPQGPLSAPQPVTGNLGWSGSLEGISMDIGASVVLSAQDVANTIKPHAQLSMDVPLAEGYALRPSIRFDITPANEDKERSVLFSLSDSLRIASGLSVTQQAQLQLQNEETSWTSYRIAAAWQVPGVVISVPLSVHAPLQEGEVSGRIEAAIEMKF